MAHSTPDHALAGTVRGLREDRAVTREALAFEAGITTGALARIESGHTSPRWATLRAIARALELRTDQLVDQVEATRAVEESAELIADGRVWDEVASRQPLHGRRQAGASEARLPAPLFVA